MFGLIGHSSSFAQAQEKARELGLEEMAEADMLAWCSAPPQLHGNLQGDQPHRQNDRRHLHRLLLRAGDV